MPMPENSSVVVTGKARDRRHEQRCTEHRDHVLHADADRARPRQPLVRRHDRSVADPPAVAVQRPSEHPGAGFPFGRASRAVLCTRHSWPILGPPPAAIHHRTALARSNHIRTECAVRAGRGRPPPDCGRPRSPLQLGQLAGTIGYVRSTPFPSTRTVSGVSPFHTCAATDADESTGMLTGPPVVTSRSRTPSRCRTSSFRDPGSPTPRRAYT